MARHAYAIMNSNGVSVLAVRWKCDVPSWRHVQDVLGADKYGYQLAAYPTAERAVEVAEKLRHKSTTPDDFHFYDVIRIKLCT